MADKRKGNDKPGKTRRVEYYRLWGGDSGTWDTDFIEIPADTSDKRLTRRFARLLGKSSGGMTCR